VHFITTNPLDLTSDQRNSLELVAEGWSHDKAIEIFRHTRSLQHGEFREILDKMYSPLPEMLLDNLFGHPFSSVPNKFKRANLH
jgi:hypothetical protein